MSNFSSLVIVGVFAFAAAIVWVAGIALSNSTHELDERWKLGEALGGMLLLSVAGTLPEIAITVSAAIAGNLGLAAGNLIGGIALQTAVLVIVDAVASRERPLTYLVGSLVPVLEALLVCALVSLAIMGALLPESTSIGPMSPASIAIVVVWLGGLVLIARMRDRLEWPRPEGAMPGRLSRCNRKGGCQTPYDKTSTPKVLAIFLLGSLATLAGGVALQYSGAELASRVGLSGGVFGATVLALVTALPEITTSVQAVLIGDNMLAVGDIFGGNAFQLCLFLVADLAAGTAVLPTLGPQNVWLAAAGLLVTAIYAIGIVIRPPRTWLRLGPDSIAVLVLYAVAVAGLLTLG
ncbi:MAG: sodium:calcium antiporter [Coriobacteriia bacterium]